MAFKPGQSGNPAGRKPLITNSQQFRDAIAPDMPELIETLKGMALSGDMAAAKLLLDRSYPTLKAQTLPVTVPAGNGLADTGNNILGAALSAQIPPDVAQVLIGALAAQAKVVETTELSERLDRIEKLLEEKK